MVLETDGMLKLKTSEEFNKMTIYKAVVGLGKPIKHHAAFNGLYRFCGI